MRKLRRQRLGRVVGHARDAPFAEVEHNKRFQHVIHLGRVKQKRHLLIAIHLALPLEIADAVFVERHAAQGGRVIVALRKSVGCIAEQ